MATNLRREHAHYTFRCMGRQGTMVAYRAPTWNTVHRNALDRQQFQGEVAGWFMDHSQGEWHVSSFKEVAGYAKMPHAFRSANALCVLIEHPTDVAGFEQAFTVARSVPHEGCVAVSVAASSRLPLRR